MQYPLAKKLKDAGFPQKGTGVISDQKYWEAVVKSYDTTGILHGYIPPEDFVSIPTLCELIEACGNDFVSLTKMGINHSGAWQADCTDRLIAEGTTPEEAVSNLWLSLQHHAE